MLRQKLLVRLGVLVVLHIVGAVIAIFLLQNVLRDLNQARIDAAGTANAIDSLENSVVLAREALENTGLPADEYRQHILAAGNEARRAYDAIALQQIATESGAECYQRIGTMLPGVAPHEDWLDDQSLASWQANAPSFVDDLMAEIVHLRKFTRVASTELQLDITRRLRHLIIGLTAAALVALNATILLLLSTGDMIVRPIEALVEHSRHLAREQFDHRVDTPDVREFSELADSYNHLAEQLSQNEQRKVETLQQFAVSLNHELNNVINIIELQLASLDRHAKGDEVLHRKLVQIHDNLHRIARTIAALKDVRRVVVTDYAEGMKMLDLSECTQPEPADTQQDNTPQPSRHEPTTGTDTT